MGWWLSRFVPIREVPVGIVPSAAAPDIAIGFVGLAFGVLVTAPSAIDPSWQERQSFEKPLGCPVLPCSDGLVYGM